MVPWTQGSEKDADVLYLESRCLGGSGPQVRGSHQGHDKVATHLGEETHLWAS